MTIFTSGITPPASAFTEGVTPPASAFAACGGAPASAWASCDGSVTPDPPTLDPIVGSVELHVISTVTLTGTNFTADAVVDIAGSGITLLSTTVLDAQTIELSIDPDDGSTGLHAVTVTTPYGTSNAEDLTIAEAVPPVAEVTPGDLRLWLESDFGIRDANGALVTKWRDRSGYNHHLLPAAGYTAPTYRSSGFPGGNAPYVEFNDLHGLASAVAAGLDLTSFGMIVELVRDAADSNSAFFYLVGDIIALGVQDSAASSYLARWNSVAHSALRESSYHTAAGWVSKNVRHRLRVAWNGVTHAGHRQYLDGVQQAIPSQLNTIFSPMISSGSGSVRLGFRDASLPQFNLQGKVKACILISPEPPAADLAAWEAYLAAK